MLLDALAAMVLLSSVLILIRWVDDIVAQNRFVAETVADFRSLASATTLINRQQPSTAINANSLHRQLPDMRFSSSTAIGLNPQGASYEVREASGFVVFSTQLDEPHLAGLVATQLGHGLNSRYFRHAGNWIVENWVRVNPSLASVVVDRAYQRNRRATNKMAASLDFSSQSFVQQDAICLHPDGISSGGIAFTSTGSLVSCQVVAGETQRRWRLATSSAPVLVPPRTPNPPKQRLKLCPDGETEVLDFADCPVRFLCPDGKTYAYKSSECPSSIICSDGQTQVFDLFHCPVKSLCPDGKTYVYKSSECPARVTCQDGQTQVYDLSQCPAKSLCPDGKTYTYQGSLCPSKVSCQDGVTEVYDLSQCPQAITCWDNSIVYAPAKCPSQTYTCSDPAKTVVDDTSKCPTLCPDQTTWEVDQSSCPDPTMCWNGVLVYPPTTCAPKTLECSDPNKTQVTDLTDCPKLCSDQTTWLQDLSSCPSLCPDGVTWELDSSQCPSGTTCWDQSVVYAPQVCPVQPVDCWDGTTVTPPATCRPNLQCPKPDYAQETINGQERCVCVTDHVSCFGPGNFCSNPVTVVIEPGASGQKVYSYCASGGETTWY